MMHLLQLIEGSPFRGEILAVGAGLVWAVAVLLYRTSGRSVHPLGLNLFKTMLGTLLLALTLLVLGQPIFPRRPWQSYGLVAASGIIGITLSDTLFFACLNRLGAGLTAIVDCVNIPFVILFSFLFIDERLTARQLLGVFLILLAIVLVSGQKDAGLPPRRDLIRGIWLGISAMVTMAAGIVMIKPVLRETPVLWATFLRVASAGVVLAGLILAHPERRPILRPLRSLANWKSMVPATFLGSYIALLAWMAGMKYTQASVAAPLSQLNSVFIFVLAAVFLKEKVTPLKTAAVILATLGAVLVSWPG
jgi:drug/metabolite transporter (DMT)-like permease